LNYFEENLTNAKKALIRLYQTIKDITLNDVPLDEHWIGQFNQAMNDDFNTPIALSVLFQLSHEVNKNNSPALAATLKHLAGLMGLLQEEPNAFLQAGFADDDKESIERLIEERIQARKDRNWAKADEIRSALLGRGIELEDGEQGTTWRKIS
jgi:cysteinyl-tRNA synthetase